MRYTLLLLVLGFSSGNLLAQDWDAFIDAYMGTSADADSFKLDADDSLELSETAFRYIFDHNRAIKPRKSKYFILSYLHCARHLSLDPDPPYMAALSDIKPRVRSSSFYFKNRKRLYGKVMFFFITEMEMTGRNKAEVRIGYYQTDDACAGHIYHFKRINGVWELQRSVIEWQL